MDRLTERRPDGRIETTGRAYSEFHMDYVNHARINDKYDMRLAEYEDTGLAPEQISETISLLQTVTTKYETSVKMHSITTELLNKAEAQAAAMLSAIREIHRVIHPHNGPRYSKRIDDICDQFKEKYTAGKALLDRLAKAEAVVMAANLILRWRGISKPDDKEASCDWVKFLQENGYWDRYDGCCNCSLCTRAQEEYKRSVEKRLYEAVKAYREVTPLQQTLADMEGGGA